MIPKLTDATPQAEPRTNGKPNPNGKPHTNGMHQTKGTPQANGRHHTNGTPLTAEDQHHFSIAMDALRRIVRALRTAHPSSRGYQNLSAAQLFVLQQVAAAPGLSLAELCQRTLTSPSSASEVVARLVAAGFVLRRTSSRDQRRASFVLTAEGVGVVAGAPDSMQQRLQAGFHALRPEDQRSLARLLDAWIGEAGIGTNPATLFLVPVADEASAAEGRGVV